MGKTVWHLTMSLDGFMADDHDSLSWMPRDAGGIPMGMAFIPTIGAIIAGRRTFDYGISKPDGKPYGGAFTGPIVVVSHRKPPTKIEPSISFAPDLVAGISEAHSLAGDQNVAILGPGIGQQLLRKNRVDEILVHIAPVLIGSGVPAFALGESWPQALDVLERSGSDDMTTLRLRPRRNVD
jgi:dihydrofolate reductase